jgi:hypothetical protein
MLIYFNKISGRKIRDKELIKPIPVLGVALII